MSPVLLFSMLFARQAGPIADRLVVPNSLGVNVHEQSPHFNFSDGQNHQMFDYGFRTARIEVAWQDTQIRVDGPFHMQKSDELVHQTVDAGLRPLILLDYNNFKITGGVSPNTPELIGLFNRFVETCVRRYSKFNPIWEIGNEPSHKTFWQPKPNFGDYTRLVIATAKTIKDTDPNAVVCAGSFFAVDEQFIQTFVAEGGLSLIDDISLHPYNHHAPEAALPFYRHVQNLIKSKNLDHRVGIINSECGYAEDWKAISRARAASYYPRIYLTSLMAGIDLTILYEWSDRGEDQFPSPSYFGLLDTENRPKPAFNSLQTLLKQLDGYRLDRFRANGPQNEFIMVFTKGSSSKLVAWIADRDPEDMDPGTADPKTYEDPPAAVQFEGRSLTLTSSPKVFPL